jgi:hypothetical protein
MKTFCDVSIYNLLLIKISWQEKSIVHGVLDNIDWRSHQPKCLLWEILHNFIDGHFIVKFFDLWKGWIIWLELHSRINNVLAASYNLANHQIREIKRAEKIPFPVGKDFYD